MKFLYSAPPPPPPPPFLTCCFLDQCKNSFHFTAGGLALSVMLFACHGTVLFFLKFCVDIVLFGSVLGFYNNCVVVVVV